VSRPPKIADRLPEPRRETGRPAARLADETAATESTDDDSLRAAKSAPREEIDAYATQTFHIEVSAGRPQGAGETKIAPLHRVASDHRRRSDQQDHQLIQSEPRADAQVAAATIKTIASPRRRSDSSVHGDSQRRKRRRRVPPWLVSLYLHAVLLAVLALVTLADGHHVQGFSICRVIRQHRFEVIECDRVLAGDDFLLCGF